MAKSESDLSPNSLGISPLSMTPDLRRTRDVHDSKPTVGGARNDVDVGFTESVVSKTSVLVDELAEILNTLTDRLF
jgi:hypothetical protein